MGRSLVRLLVRPLVLLVRWVRLLVRPSAASLARSLVRLMQLSVRLLVRLRPSARPSARSLMAVFTVSMVLILSLTAQTQSTNSNLSGTPLKKPLPAEDIFNGYEQVFSLLAKNDFFINLEKTNEITENDLKDFFAKINIKKPEKKVYRWVDIPKGRPLSLKTYQGRKAKRISEDALRRINQSHNYLKNRDFSAFKDINLDIILRQHFSISAPQSAFLVARLLLQQSEQGAIDAFQESLLFFAYIINAHRFTQYSDGSLVLLIPVLFERGYYEMAGKLLKLYRKLQKKIVKINWDEQLSVRPEEQNIQLSKKEIEEIKKRFAVAVVLLAKLDRESGQTGESGVSSKSGKLNKKNDSINKTKDYLMMAKEMMTKEMMPKK